MNTKSIYIACGGKKMRIENLWLRRKMEKNGIQMQQLAKKIGRSHSTVSNWFSKDLTGMREKIVIKAIRDLIEEKKVIPQEEIMGEAIKKNRKACRMTQKQLASSIGVSVLSIKRWEAGARTPNFKNAKALADLFGIAVSELVEEKKTKPQVKVQDEVRLIDVSKLKNHLLSCKESYYSLARNSTYDDDIQYWTGAYEVISRLVNRIDSIN